MADTDAPPPAAAGSPAPAPDDEGEQQLAATRLQARARGRKSRRRAASKKTEKAEREKAATALQARIRGRGQRQRTGLRHREEGGAATKLQAMQRGRLARQREATRRGGGRALTRGDVQKGLSNFGRSACDLLHAFLDVQVAGEYVTDLTALSAFGRLSTVDVSDNLLTTLSVLSALPYLTELNASGNRLTECLDFGAPASTASTPLPDGDWSVGSQLRRADLSRNAIVAVRDVSHHRYLETLVLDDNAISDVGFGLAGLKHLKTLQLSGNGLKRISGLEGLPLVRLELDRNDLAELDGLDGLTALRELSVAGNGVSLLSGLERCGALQALDASDNAVAAVRQVEQVAALPALRSLCLKGNPCASLEWYRARVLLPLQSLSALDGEPVTAREKIKAVNLQGVAESDLGTREGRFEEAFSDPALSGRFFDYQPPFVEGEASPWTAAATLSQTARSTGRDILQQALANVEAAR